MTGFSTIQATVSGSTITASIAGGSISASGGSVTSFSPVQSVNGQIGSVVVGVPHYVQQNPGGMVWLITTKNTGLLSMTARSTTGYVAVMWWNGTVQLLGSGSPSVNINVSRQIPLFGQPWSSSSPKHVYVWSCGSTSSANKTGELTTFSCTSSDVSMVSAYGCSSLNSLSCDSNQITSLDLGGCVGLAELSCFSNKITELNLTGLPALASLYCQSNLLDGLNVRSNPLLQTLQCNDNSLDTLDTSANPNLYGLYCHNNFIKSLDLRGNAGLKNLNCLGNGLESINATGLALSGSLGANVSGNQLSASSLNSFYSGLANVTSGTLYVSGNPGTASDTPSIATQKGYVVNGS
jgi:hypothetical protein